MPRPLGDPIARFWRHVDKSATDGCWRWIGAPDRDGYGRFRVGGKGSRFERAHRFAWVLAHGAIPVGLCVCHRCDHPWCVNPAHLFLATNKENTADKIAKGREARGETQGLSKLTEAGVRSIRAARRVGVSVRALATQHGVSGATIYLVAKRQIWRHVS